MENQDPNHMNREQRRRYWMKNHRSKDLGTWKQFNEWCIKQKPYVNPNPKVFKYNSKKRKNKEVYGQ